MAFEDENKEENYVREDSEAPAHHPSPPPDELFDISTAVDPSYIISLIRKLVQTNMNNCCNELGGQDVPTEDLNTDNMEKSAVSLSKDKVPGTVSCDSVAMEVAEGFDKSSSHEREGEDEEPFRNLENPGVSTKETVWEECGCVLWDLAASRDHAELMVQNLVLDVLLADLTVSESVRITEICLGIIGNLACHEVLMKHVVSTNGLIGIIVDQLFLDDTQCLIEACRVLTLGLQSSECTIWADALKSEDILRRILWITENTLNPQLIEKCAGLLLAILEGRQEVVQILLPQFMALGLSSLLINLLSFEMNKLTSERIPERYPALDVILRVIESLSIADGHSQEICSSKQLLQLACDLVKFPEKVEVASSCITAGVVIANILSDADDMAPEMSQDLLLLESLFDVLSFASDDFEAKGAVWNIIARLLAHIKEEEMSLSSLDQFVLTLVSKSDTIEDDLLDHQSEKSRQQDDSLAPGSTNPDPRATALNRIILFLNKWITSMDSLDRNDSADNQRTTNIDVGRLLSCCHKYLKNLEN